MCLLLFLSLYAFAFGKFFLGRTFLFGSLGFLLDFHGRGTLGSSGDRRDIGFLPCVGHIRPLIGRLLGRFLWLSLGLLLRYRLRHIAQLDIFASKHYLA